MARKKTAVRRAAERAYARSLIKRAAFRKTAEPASGTKVWGAAPAQGPAPLTSGAGIGSARSWGAAPSQGPAPLANNAAGAKAWGAAPAQGPSLLTTGASAPKAWGAAPAQGVSAPAPANPAAVRAWGSAPAQGPATPTMTQEVLEGFGEGLQRGAKNIGNVAGNAVGGAVNFAKGMANFAVPGVAGVLAQASPHEDIRMHGREWLQQSLAGSQDMVGSLGQMVSMNGAPQHVAQHRQQIEDKYFSGPENESMRMLYRGATNAGDNAAATIPGVLGGSAALSGLSKIPGVANAGNAVQNMIRGSKYLDKPLQAASVATGVPLHPAALPGGSLTGAMGASSYAQGILPTIGVGGAMAAGRPDIAANIADAQQRFPMIQTDNFVRQNVGQNAPEYLDYLTNPGAANFAAGQQALVDAAQPYADAMAAAENDVNQNIVSDPAAPPRYNAQMMYDAMNADTYYPAGNALENAMPPPRYNAQMMYDAMNADTYDPAGNALENAMPPPTESAETAPAPADVAAKQTATLPPQFENAKPEERAQLEQAHAQVAKLPEEQKAAAKTAIQNPDSEEAAALKDKGREDMLNPANHPDDPPPSDPQGFGAWASDKMEKFQQMDSMSQIGMGLGLGLGLLGLISALGGEGGMGSFLMSALGLGVAGVMGAGAGMFGDEGMRMYGQGMQMLGGAMGMNVPQGQQDLSALVSGNLMSAAQSGGGNPAEKLQQLEMLTSQPKERAIPLLMAMDQKNVKTQADAARAYDNAVKMQQQLKSLGVNAERAQAVQQAVGNAATGISNLIERPGETLGGLANQGINYASNFFQPKPKPKTKKASAIMGLNFKDIIETGLARQAALAAVKQASRCWAGYEPVPGKEPYSDNSCRPAGSGDKKKKKEPAKKQAASSVFQLNAKKPEAVVNNVKPSTEASKEVSVTRNDPAKKEDLRPEGALLPGATKASAKKS